MEFAYCSNCAKNTGHKRALGWGTFFAVVLTCGLWLLAIPFYPKRCIICGQEFRREVYVHEQKEAKSKTLETDTEYRIFLIVVFIILGIALFIWLIKK